MRVERGKIGDPGQKNVVCTTEVTLEMEKHEELERVSG